MMGVSRADIDARVIVGMEIHVQLATRTKMFCGCRLAFGETPNTLVCPVCLGHPGVLPVINRRAIDLALRTGMALNCRIAHFTKWDRKSYYYPDLPKNYQISQYDLPICADGYFDIPGAEGAARRIRIRRAHLEEDAGKNLHDIPGCTLVDLNRAGAPLLEIVTEPDIASADEAWTFATELQRLVTYLEVSEGVMQKGQMRFEPNVNVAIIHNGMEHRTPITEVKNLNSFRSVRSSIAYEARRQIDAWLTNRDYVYGKHPNENRGWLDDREITEYQRPKEAAHDYRYFPDPDLVPVTLTESDLEQARAALPELPLARAERFVQNLGLSSKDADTIVAHCATADLFEGALALGAPADILGKQFVNAWLRFANDRGLPVAGLGVTAAHIAELAVITAEGLISRTAANQIAEAMMDNAESPRKLAEQLGLMQVQDASATQAWVEQAIRQNEKAVADARVNPKKAQAALGFLRGQVMKISGGKADPRMVGELLEKKLAEP